MPNVRRRSQRSRAVCHSSLHTFLIPCNCRPTPHSDGLPQRYSTGFSHELELRSVCLSQELNVSRSQIDFPRHNDDESRPGGPTAASYCRCCMCYVTTWVCDTLAVCWVSLNVYDIL